MHHFDIRIIVLDNLIFAKFSVKNALYVTYIAGSCPGRAELLFFFVQKETSRDSFAHDISIAPCALKLVSGLCLM